MSVSYLWAAIPVQGCDMERINLPFYYTLGAALNPLAQTNLTTVTKGQLYVTASVVRFPLRTLLDSVESLKVCRADGEQLLRAIDDMERWFNQAELLKQFAETIQPGDFVFQNVVMLAARFEPVLSADLAALITYWVTQKGIYDTADLIERAEGCLPVPAQQAVGEMVVADLRQAGRCLVLDSPTACGFHTIRALETVLHSYYVAVCKPPDPEKKLKSWSAYLAALYKVEDEEVKKVYYLLYQMKGDRNDIMHPEMVLSADEALAVFETAQAAIIAMADRLTN